MYWVKQCFEHLVVETEGYLSIAAAVIGRYLYSRSFESHAVEPKLGVRMRKERTAVDEENVFD